MTTTNNIYVEFAYIAYSLMCALVPAEQAIDHAEQSLTGDYSLELVAAAKHAVLNKIADWGKPC